MCVYTLKCICSQVKHVSMLWLAVPGSLYFIGSSTLRSYNWLKRVVYLGINWKCLGNAAFTCEARKQIKDGVYVSYMIYKLSCAFLAYFLITIVLVFEELHNFEEICEKYINYVSRYSRGSWKIQWIQISLKNYYIKKDTLLVTSLKIFALASNAYPIIFVIL